MPLAFLGALLSMLGLKEEAKEEVTTAPPPDKETTYYHVTTSENAASIMAGGVMYGSTGEGGYIYAWKKCPNSKAIKDAGTRGTVVISFTTSAAFEPDPAFYEMPYVNSFLPVRSVFPGPIKVSNVVIIGD